MIASVRWHVHERDLCSGQAREDILLLHWNTRCIRTARVRRVCARNNGLSMRIWYGKVANKTHECLSKNKTKCLSVNNYNKKKFWVNKGLRVAHARHLRGVTRIKNGAINNFGWRSVFLILRKETLFSIIRLLLRRKVHISLQILKYLNI